MSGKKTGRSKEPPKRADKNKKYALARRKAREGFALRSVFFQAEDVVCLHV